MYAVPWTTIQAGMLGKIIGPLGVSLFRILKEGRIFQILIFSFS
jgi:hypothetical protein